MPKSELQVSAKQLEQLRDLEEEARRCDEAVGALKEELKTAREEAADADAALRDEVRRLTDPTFQPLLREALNTETGELAQPKAETVANEA
jgi:predicted house-cleaning noncanonical NTP pyrophosphatase (MazG superfamily)